MKSAKSSSNKLQRTLMFNASSVNSSPQSKTTTATFNPSIKEKCRVGEILMTKKINSQYKKINMIRSSLLSLTNNDITKKKKFFEAKNASSSICIHQEFDVTSMEISLNSPSFGRHSSIESELYVDSTSALGFKALHSSPQMQYLRERRESSKNSTFQLFQIKRESIILSKNSSVSEKRPFVDRLSTIACNLRASMSINSNDRLDDLQLLSNMIKGRVSVSPIKKDTVASLAPILKFQSDNNVKKNCFRDSITTRLSGKAIRSSQNLNSDASTKVTSPSNGADIRLKEKNHKTSKILILIPCGTSNPNNNE